MPKCKCCGREIKKFEGRYNYGSESYCAKCNDAKRPDLGLIPAAKNMELLRSIRP